MTASLFSHCTQSHQQRLHLLSQTEMSRPSPGNLMYTPRSECSSSSLIKHIAHQALSNAACASLYVSYRLECGIPLHKDSLNACALPQIDYINLTYTSSGMDVYEMREFLDENNGENVKIIAKVHPDHFERLWEQC